MNEYVKVRAGDGKVLSLLARDLNHLVERTTTPDAPAGDEVILFAKDNGAGKTQLCALFATGAAQVIATQP